MAKKEVSYQQFSIAEAAFVIEGTSPLIMHKFSEKSKRMMEDKQQKKSKVGKEVRDPEADYLGALYTFGEDRYGFPSGGFKAAMIRAGKQLGYVMADLKGCFFIIPDDKETNLVEIHGSHNMRTDMVRIGNGTADIRYRPEFKSWGAVLRIQYNDKVLSTEQVAELIALAGFACGIGDWRPEKAATGTFGTWKLA